MKHYLKTYFQVTHSHSHFALRMINWLTPPTVIVEPADHRHFPEDVETQNDLQKIIKHDNSSQFEWLSVLH